MAFGKRVQALAKVCGLDLRIGAHRRQCEQAARQLAPYDAALILQRFGPLTRGKRQATCRGTWQWYVDDWRGARKGEQPRPNDVVANISRERVQVGPEEAKSVFSDAASGSAAEAGLGPAQIAFREFMRQEARRGGR